MPERPLAVTLAIGPAVRRSGAAEVGEGRERTTSLQPEAFVGWRRRAKRRRIHVARLGLRNDGRILTAPAGVFRSVTSLGVAGWGADDPLRRAAAAAAFPHPLDAQAFERARGTESVHR